MSTLSFWFRTCMVMRLLLVAATFGSFCGCATSLQAGRIDALVAARTTVLPSRPALTRRAWAWAAAASSAFLPASRTRALITAPICASGVGDGCEELAESPLIAELQARSAEKREQRRKEALERYSVNNFNDFFAVENKQLVRHADGAPRRPWTLDATSLLLDGVEGDARLSFHHKQARSRPCRRTSSPRGSRAGASSTARAVGASRTSPRAGRRSSSTSLCK